MKAMKFDLKDFFEQLNAKWEEIKKQNEENKNFEKCENVDENKGFDTYKQKIEILGPF